MPILTPYLRMAGVGLISFSPRAGQLWPSRLSKIEERKFRLPRCLPLSGAYAHNGKGKTEAKIGITRHESADRNGANPSLDQPSM